MRQQLQIALVERALRHLESGTTDLVAAGENPVANYRDPARLESEQRILFRRFPLLVAFSSQLLEPGDFVTHDLSGVPLLITRDDAGRLRAFQNVCRHRGARLVEPPSGKGRRRFACRFHGWSYGLDGALAGTTSKAAFPDLDPDACGLVEVACDERCGLVFAIPTPGITFDLDRWLGPLGEDMAGFGFDAFVMTSPTSRERRMNWKLHMDATQEIYHLPYLHRSTAGSGFFAHCSLLDFLRPHCRVVMPADSLRDLAGTDPETWRLQDHAGIVFGIFPNTTALYHSGVMQVLSTWPVAVDRAVLAGGMMVPEGAADLPEILRRKQHFDTYWATMEEDMEICESMQSTMASGANESLRFGRSEGLLATYHATVEDALQGRLEL